MVARSDTQSRHEVVNATPHGCLPLQLRVVHTDETQYGGDNDDDERDPLDFLKNVIEGYWGTRLGCSESVVDIVLCLSNVEVSGNRRDSDLFGHGGGWVETTRVISLRSLI